jgi:hypothetical protein
MVGEVDTMPRLYAADERIQSERANSAMAAQRSLGFQLHRHMDRERRYARSFPRI